MRPWERRLRDLACLLNNCGSSYFSPDRFRQNTNQFLQTSRTVTFIIQKNKASIPDYESWYKKNVLMPWADDHVMTWAKDARNVVEKEGDLDMHSQLRLAVLFSYESESDMVLDTSRHDLLRSNIDRLHKAALQKLPPDIANSAVLKIQRRWIANTLPDCELIYALTYAYAQLHRVCDALASHLGSTLDPTVPHPTEIDPVSNDAGKVRYMKFSTLDFSRQSRTSIKADKKFKAPPEISRLKEELSSASPPSSLDDIVSIRSKMAQRMFEQCGKHIPMLMLYDKDWKPIDFMSTMFTDQAEKFIFWRNVADRAFYLKAHAMVWTCESWLQKIKDNHTPTTGELPIVGEQLHVVGADATGATKTVIWNITRPSNSSAPILENEDMPGRMAFVEPVIAAMKLVRANRH